MADRFDLTPVDHDPFEAMGAIPGLMPKPNALQAAPTSLQGNIAGLGLPAGVLAKYAGEQVDNAYSMATLPGDVALGRTDPNSPEGFSRTFGLALGLAGGPLASPKGGVKMGFNGAIDPLAAEVAPKLTAALAEWKKQNNLTPHEEIVAQLVAKGHNADDAQLAASLAHSQPFEDKPLNLDDYKPEFQQPLQHAFEMAGQPFTTDAKLGKAPAQPSYTASPKPLDHSYWGNELLNTLHDPDFLAQMHDIGVKDQPSLFSHAAEHVKDLAPDSSHAAIDAAAKEYVPHAIDLLQSFDAHQIQHDVHLAIPKMQNSEQLAAALPGVKKFLGIEEPKPTSTPSHTVTPVEHDPFAGTVPPVDMNALYGGLSMDPAARRDRARQLGFNPDLTLYHGRKGEPFGAFEKNEFRDPALKSERGIFLADRPDVAEAYAGGDVSHLLRGEVMPLLARMENPHVIDVKGRHYGGWVQQEINAARSLGHDSLVIQNMKDLPDNTLQTQYAIFDPRNLRSKFAAFNPAYRDSANLLSTRGGPFALTPVDHDPWEQR